MTNFEAHCHFVKVDRPGGQADLLRMPLSSRTRGMYLIGKNGTGKTTLMLQMITSDILMERGVCVLDPHGDLVDDLLARVPPDRAQDVVLIDLRASETPFGLNIFQCADPSDPILAAETTEQVVQVFEKIWGDLSWGPLLEDLLGNIAHTMIENPGMTMAEVPRLLTDDDFRRELIRNLRNSVVRDFWHYEYDPMSDREQRENRRSTLNKVRDFVRNPLMRNIIGQSETTVDFRDVIDNNRILLIKLDTRLENATALIGSMMVQQLLNAALGRRDRASRDPFMLYADEYHRFATPAFGTLIDEARKYGIATTIAHQRRSQLRPGEQRVAPLGAVNLVVFSVLGEDAEDLAKQFDATPKPTEPVLKMVTEPVYEEWIEEVWNSPDYPQQLAEAREQLKDQERRLAVLESLFGRDMQRNGLQNWVDNDKNEKISYYFNPDLAWLNRYHEEITDRPIPLRTDPPTKGKPVVFSGGGGGAGWNEWLLWRIPPAWPSLIQSRLSEAKRRDKRRDQCLYEYGEAIEPIVERFRRSHQEYWSAPRKSLIAGHLQFRELRVAQCPEGVAWVRAKVGNLQSRIEILQKQIEFLQAGRHRIPKRRYLYDRPVKDVAESVVARTGETELQRYRWEPGPPRTFADTQLEIANELTSLPTFYAKAKLMMEHGVSEHYLWALRSDPLPTPSQFKPAGRSRHLVEQELATRRPQMGANEEEDTMDEDMPPLPWQ